MAGFDPTLEVPVEDTVCCWGTPLDKRAALR